MNELTSPHPSLATTPSEAGLQHRAGSEYSAPLVSVVIPCYNQGHFLSEAIESALDQSYANVEVIVVDDGSSDSTAEVAKRYPAAKYVFQSNEGLAAARNTGMKHSQGEILLFLDADDRLLPEAIEHGVESLKGNPAAGFSAGLHRWISASGTVLGYSKADHSSAATYASLLGGNFIGMHATVTYRREALAEVGGFDPQMRACEDYDLYLRIARRYPICLHDGLMADYRMHGSNMTRNGELMLTTALHALEKQWKYVRKDRSLRRAHDQGVDRWLNMYGPHLLRDVSKDWQPTSRTWWQRTRFLLEHAPRWVLQNFTQRWIRGVYSGLRRLLPGRIASRAERRFPFLKHDALPTVGRVRFGDLRRTTPISCYFGYDRGTPIDRYYIEGFLNEHAEDIKGRVLEVKDATYTLRFGKYVDTIDVLDVDAGNQTATIVCDLSKGDALPSSAFDCIILTQTLQWIYDLPAAIKTVYRALKAGGVVLVTCPGISQIEGGEIWYWLMTDHSARKLFETAFPSELVSVRSFGNVLAAQSFLQGLAAEELTRQELDYRDSHYNLVVAVRARKPDIP